MPGPDPPGGGTQPKSRVQLTWPLNPSSSDNCALGQCRLTGTQQPSSPHNSQLKSGAVLMGHLARVGYAGYNGKL